MAGVKVFVCRSCPKDRPAPPRFSARLLDGTAEQSLAQVANLRMVHCLGGCPAESNVVIQSADTRIRLSGLAADATPLVRICQQINQGEPADAAVAGSGMAGYITAAAPIFRPRNRPATSQEQR
jgi:predicted metal-binding protein